MYRLNFVFTEIIMSEFIVPVKFKSYCQNKSGVYSTGKNLGFTSRIRVGCILLVKLSFTGRILPGFYRSFTGIQLSQGCRATTSREYFLSFSSLEFLVLNWSTSEGWKTELTLEPPSGFEPRTLGLGIQSLTETLF